MTFLYKSPSFIIYEKKPMEEWMKINNTSLSGRLDIQIILRLSSFGGRLPLEHVFIETFFDLGLILWAYV